MTWINKGNSNEFHESEIVLNFVDYPDEHIGEYSNELFQYLDKLNTKVINVTSEVASDFGCFRGFSLVNVGGLSNYKSRWGYASVNDNKGFFPKQWWCR